MRQYLDLLKIPGVLRLIFSVAPGRFAYSMLNLATFFYVKEATGSIAIAGLATGLEGIASALTAGLRAGLIDRFGQTKPFAIYVPLWALSLFAMTLNDEKSWVLVMATFVGFFSPPINLASRPLWRDAVGAKNLRTAFAIDTTLMNSVTVIGPIVATYVSLQFSGSAALWLTCIMMTAGGTAMMTMPLSRQWKPEVAQPSVKGLFKSRAYQVIIIEGMIFGFGWGMLEITIPGYASLVDRPELSAPLLSTLALASIVGGLVIGGRKSSITPLNGFKIASLFVSLCAAPLVLTSPGLAMGAVLLALGLAIGFAQVYHWETLEAVRPVGSATSASAWLWTIEGSMLAIGAALGGYLIEHVNPKYAVGLVSLALLSATTFIWLIGSKYLSGANRPLSEVQKVEALADLETPLE
jgi:MFS family permease